MWKDRSPSRSLLQPHWPTSRKKEWQSCQRQYSIARTRILDTELRTGLRIQDSGFKTQDRTQDRTQDSGLKTQELGFRTGFKTRFRTGFRTQDVQDIGQNLSSQGGSA